MDKNFTRYAFTPSVKAQQEHYGSRVSYQRMEDSGDRYLLTEKETEYIATLDHFYMATVGENGWPYVQFRGEPIGFLKVLDQQTIGFADYAGNRQYISVGNIKSGSKFSLILLDFARQVRLKIWASTIVIESAEDPDLAAKLSDPNYGAKVERLITLTIEGYDWNCPKNITQRYTVEEIAANPEMFGVI
ncbi:MAG: pyridoxamine 5'-phosphate oxidase family protein [Rubritalea sp.]|tara:strand:- start:143 stop:709 length:567 start_codon:yes stop_codon:yes gene_type:complete